MSSVKIQMSVVVVLLDVKNSEEFVYKMAENNSEFFSVTKLNFIFYMSSGNFC